MVNMATKGLRKSFFLILVVLVTLMAGGQAVFADNGETKPLTAPPPDMIQPLALYTGYTYLLGSSIAIQDNTGFVRISVTTSAKSSVSTIGASVQLQRYTGTAWIDVGSSTTRTASDTSYLSDSVDKVVSTGYYYRAKVTHYVTHGSVHESEVEYSVTVLAS
jgi:hypothetical protein